MVDYNEAFDEMSEQRKYSRAGFTKGYAMGEEAGWREGFLFGLKKGASLATEIGFYQGYTTAWLTLLEKQDQGKARKVQALRSLLDMARTFPLEEQLLSSLSTSSAGGQRTPAADPILLTPGSGGGFTPRLSKIRAKFRQVQGLLLDQQQPHHHQPQQQTQRGVPPSSGGPTTHVPSATGTTTTSATHQQQPLHHPQQHPTSASHPASSQPPPRHTLRPPPSSGVPSSQLLYQNWINRSRSPVFASFESRTSSQMDGTAPTEMSF